MGHNLEFDALRRYIAKLSDKADTILQVLDSNEFVNNTFPITSLDQLLEIENKLQDPEKLVFSQKINRLIRNIYMKLKPNLTAVLRNLIDVSVLIEYNWRGISKRRKLKDLTLIKIHLFGKSFCLAINFFF